MRSDTREAFINTAGTAAMNSAYLVICSRPGAAKRATDLFLQKLYCKKGGCGNCPDCRSVLSGRVDIMRLSAPKVDALREAISFVAERAEGHKSVVIENADDMTDSAANSMLKTLEEPPKNTVFILQARSSAGVLPTIVSRCAAIYISADKDAEKIIQEKLNADSVTAHILADLSGGFFEEAEAIYKDQQFWDARSIMLDNCDKLLYQNNFAISTYADFLDTNKERLSSLLGVMQSYFRDILVYKKTGNSELIINGDRADSIMKAAQDFTSGAISNIIDVILETERRFFFPVNFRLAAEKMFFNILEEKHKWKKS